MNIAKEIGMPALLGQTAEECMELGKACLKLQRILMGCNPTPVTKAETIAAITEEAQDVKDCLWLLDREGINVVDMDQSKRKMKRGEKRIQEARGK